MPLAWVASSARFLKADGVLTASVNLAAETATVRYATGAISPAQIAALSTEAGYPAKVKSADTSDKEERKAHEIRSLARRTLLAAVLALPVFVLEMGTHVIPGMHDAIVATIGIQNSYYFQFVLASIVLFGPGLQFYTKGFPALFKGAPDMNSLVALGTSARLWVLAGLHLPARPSPGGHGQCVLRGGRRHRGADPAGPLSGGQGQRAHRRGDSQTCRLAGQDGAGGT